MNICMISDDYNPAITGVGVYLQCTVDELNKMGHKVVVITTRRKGELHIEDHQGIIVHRVFTKKITGFNLGFTRSKTIQKILKEHNIDVVHLHYFGYLMFAGIMAARKLKIKRVLSFHIKPYQFTCHIKKVSKLITAFGLLEKASFHLMKLACNACDLVLVPSTGMLEAVRSYGVTAPLKLSFYTVKQPGAKLFPLPLDDPSNTTSPSSELTTPTDPISMNIN